ncbi:hypothetical protein, partial [Staphylococcus felis]
LQLYKNCNHNRYYPETLILYLKILLDQNRFNDMLDIIDNLKNYDTTCCDIDYFEIIIYIINIEMNIKKCKNKVFEVIQNKGRSYINSSHEHIKFLLGKLLIMENNHKEAKTIKDSLSNKEVKNYLDKEIKLNSRCDNV